ncbi:MAG: hypothetical protein ACE5II_01970, partial [Anaerolineae bacterium]
AVKVKQEELDALYNYDYALAEGVDQLSERLDSLAAATAAEVIAAAGEDLVSLLEEINTTFSRRMDVMLGLAESNE